MFSEKGEGSPQFLTILYFSNQHPELCVLMFHTPWPETVPCQAPTLPKNISSFQSATAQVDTLILEGRMWPQRRSAHVQGQPLPGLCHFQTVWPWRALGASLSFTVQWGENHCPFPRTVNIECTEQRAWPGAAPHQSSPELRAPVPSEHHRAFIAWPSAVLAVNRESNSGWF